MQAPQLGRYTDAEVRQENDQPIAGSSELVVLIVRKTREMRDRRVHAGYDSTCVVG